MWFQEGLFGLVGVLFCFMNYITSGFDTVGFCREVLVYLAMMRFARLAEQL